MFLNIFNLTTTTTIMITYEIRMNDGEHVAYRNNKEEALKFRSEYQRNFISRWCNVYEICTSKVNKNLYSEKKIC